MFKILNHSHEKIAYLDTLEKVKQMTAQVLQQLFNYFGLTMNIEQYVLVGSMVRSYLSWLKDSGKIDILFENNRMLWKTIA